MLLTNRFMQRIDRLLLNQQKMPSKFRLWHCRVSNEQPTTPRPNIRLRKAILRPQKGCRNNVVENWQIAVLCSSLLFINILFVCLLVVVSIVRILILFIRYVRISHVWWCFRDFLFVCFCLFFIGSLFTCQGPTLLLSENVRTIRNDNSQ